jgi:hypothetical protein
MPGNLHIVLHGKKPRETASERTAAALRQQLLQQLGIGTFNAAHFALALDDGVRISCERDLDAKYTAAVISAITTIIINVIIISMSSSSRCDTVIIVTTITLDTADAAATTTTAAINCHHHRTLLLNAIVGLGA